MSRPNQISHREMAPEPPWRLPAPRRRRQPLTREAIVDAALEVLDADGLEGLSMRRVADELSTGPASLYAHIRNKEDLLDLVLDRVLAELELPEPDPDNWLETIKIAARESRRVTGQHRDIARISLGRIPVGPNAVRVMERWMALLRAGGLSADLAALAGDLAALYLGAFGFEQSLAEETSMSGEFSPGQMADMVREYFDSLPPDQFPNMKEMGATMMDHGPEERFEFGLEVILRGLQTYGSGPAAAAKASAREKRPS